MESFAIIQRHAAFLIQIETKINPRVLLFKGGLQQLAAHQLRLLFAQLFNFSNCVIYVLGHFLPTYTKSGHTSP